MSHPEVRGRLSLDYLRYVLLDLLLSRGLPAAFFSVLALVKALNLARRLEAGVEAPILSYNFIYYLQQSLTVAFLALAVVLFLIRRSVVGKHSSILGALVALAGTFAFSVPVLANPREDLPLLLLFSSLLIFGGGVVAIVSLVSLGRCIGIMPEARGLVTSGPYRWVRHPVYLGEITSSLGLTLAASSLPVALVFLVFCGLQYWRALNEEKALEQVFPEYEAYRQHTRRIIPWIL